VRDRLAEFCLAAAFVCFFVCGLYMLRSACLTIAHLMRFLHVL
jgi:hypothetical protein